MNVPPRSCPHEKTLDHHAVEKKPWQLKAVTLKLVGREELALGESRAARNTSSSDVQCSLFFFHPSCQHTGGEKRRIPAGKKPHGLKIFFEQRINNDSLTFASALGHIGFRSLF